MFNHIDSSMFDYQDEIGIDSCREDFNAVFNSNLTTVKLIHNNNDSGDIPYDYSGVIKSKIYTEVEFGNLKYSKVDYNTTETDNDFVAVTDRELDNGSVYIPLSGFRDSDSGFIVLDPSKQYRVSFTVADLTDIDALEIYAYDDARATALGTITTTGDYSYEFTPTATDDRVLQFFTPTVNSRNATFEITNLQFDEITTNSIKDSEELIKINIMSNNADFEELQEQGFERKGEVRYNCYASWDTNIKNSDTVEFIADCDYNIQQGSRFRVEFKDSGLYQGQYTFKNFDLIQK